MREIVQLAVIIAFVITKGRFIAGARSEAPQRSKMGKKILVMTSAYAHPYVRTGRELLSGLCRGIQDVLLAFVLAKRKPVHLEAAKCGANVPLTLNENESGI